MRIIHKTLAAILICSFCTFSVLLTVYSPPPAMASDPAPTENPSPEPTDEPTENPSPEPTDEPTENPSPEPTDEPTESPSPEPTDEPTESPSPEPTIAPTVTPQPTTSAAPSTDPTATPVSTLLPTLTPVPTPTPTPPPIIPSLYWIPPWFSTPNPFASQQPTPVPAATPTVQPFDINAYATPVPNLGKGYSSPIPASSTPNPRRQAPQTGITANYVLAVSGKTESLSIRESDIGLLDEYGSDGRLLYVDAKGYDQDSISFSVRFEDCHLLGQYVDSIMLGVDFGDFVVDISAINWGDISASLIATGISPANAVFSIGIETATADSLDKLRQNVAVAGNAFTFRLCVFSGSQIIGVNPLKYTRFEIPLPSPSQTSLPKTMVAMRADGSIGHVPTRFVQRGESVIGVVNSVYSGGVYAFAYTDPLSQVYEEMPQRYAFRISGGNLINHELTATRNSFAILLLNSLGLDPVKSFTDAGYGGTAYNLYSNATASYGLTMHARANLFSGDVAVNRLEAYEIMAAALAFIGVDCDLNEQEINALLAGYKAEQIPIGLKKAVALCVKYSLAGLTPSGNLTDMVTNSQVADMCYKMLYKLGLID